MNELYLLNLYLKFKLVNVTAVIALTNSHPVCSSPYLFLTSFLLRTVQEEGKYIVDRSDYKLLYLEVSSFEQAGTY